MGKKFPSISQGIKTNILLIELSKFSKNMPHCAFFNYANYALRAKLCNFASMHNSGSPDWTISQAPYMSNTTYVTGPTP